MLEKACSMGFKSGEYGGRKISLHSSEIVSTYNSRYKGNTYALHPQQASVHLQHDGCYNYPIRECFEALGMDS